ncbi:MAG TPA: alkaline phosphatase family protein [Solirubrobacterales bacterium]|nr:alkaline phosphatase family protein [Solirubrobacterales bacterium]
MRAPAGGSTAALHPSSPLDGIENIVVLMMENRSFDQMLGYLTKAGMPKVNGLSGGEVNYDANGKPYPSYAFAAGETAFRLPGKDVKALDPCHSPSCVEEQLAAGNSGFVKNFIKEKNPPPDKRKIVMGHYTAEQLPVYDFLARNYCVCDAWHSSIPGDTWPNRLFALAGTDAPEPVGHEPDRLRRFLRWAAGVPFVKGLGKAPIFEVEAFTRQLRDRDWRWYSHDPATLRAADGAYRNFRKLNRDNFAFFDRRKVSVLTEALESQIVGHNSFLDDAAAGTLRPVSWIDPNFFDLRVLDPNSDDDHPPSDVRAGQALVLEVYEALVNGPQWENTMLVITYDEHGGFYDHVEPPAAPADESGRKTLGVRVPALVVGSRVRKGVCKETLEHTALPKTILSRFAPQPAELALAQMPPSVRKARDLSGVLLGSPRDDIPDHAFLHEKIDAWRDRARRDHRAEGPRSPASEGAGQPLVLHDFQDEFAQFALAMRDLGLPPGQP